MTALYTYTPILPVGAIRYALVNASWPALAITPSSASQPQMAMGTGRQSRSAAGSETVAEMTPKQNTMRWLDSVDDMLRMVTLAAAASTAPSRPINTACSGQPAPSLLPCGNRITATPPKPISSASQL